MNAANTRCMVRVCWCRLVGCRDVSRPDWSPDCAVPIIAIDPPTRCLALSIRLLPLYVAPYCEKDLYQRVSE